MPGVRLAVVCVVGAIAFAGCGDRQQGIDLLRSEKSKLAEAQASGQKGTSARAGVGRPQRIRNVVRASLPASPPSHYRFVTDVPRRGRLVVAAGIPGRHQQASAIEFLVRVRERGQERTLLSQLVDPLNRPAHRQWVTLEADLSSYAGRGVEIVLETRGFEERGPPDRAFWGTPTITAADDASRPLVIVYLVDTLRADHLPLYGYSRDTAPELSRFAKDAVVFDQAIASSSWTKPSVASLFTSLLPRDHGCVQFYTPLDPVLETLAETMRDHGYATGAVVVNQLVLARNMHFDQGFSYFAAPPAPQRAGEVVDAALDFLDARKGQPTFLYLHTMDAHTPYLPPPPFDRQFGPRPAPGRAAAEPSDYRVPRDLDRIVGQYDGAVAYGDQQFGRLLRGLRERGLYERALVVFLADHGEEFLDHGGWVHGHTLYDELVRVPLVVKYPGRRDAGRRVRSQVQLLDVMPTILKSQGLKLPTAIMGRALEESFDASARERVALLETKYRDYVAYGARVSAAKYVRQLDSGAELVFDLSRDPQERSGRHPEASTRGRALQRAAEVAVSRGAFRHRVRVDGDVSYELRLRTNGRFEVFERVGLGPAERADVIGGGHVLALSLRPQPGRPREVEVLAWPHGVAVWIDGLRNGRKLRPGEVRVAESGVAARRLPFRFPEVENLDGLFSRPRPLPRGVTLWLIPNLGMRGGPRAVDRQVREDLKSLGYLP
jgi:arylsulfatase A-like enzyme